MSCIMPLSNPTFAIIGCSKRKLLSPAPAKQLYQGDVFKLARAYVESLGLTYWIFSAEHGLIHPDRFLEPYDTGVSDLSGKDKVWLGAQFNCDLVDKLPISHWKNCVFLAGNAYWRIAERYLMMRYNVERPLANLGIGQQKHWLRMNTKALSIQRLKQVVER